MKLILDLTGNVHGAGNAAVFFDGGCELAGTRYIWSAGFNPALVDWTAPLPADFAGNRYRLVSGSLQRLPDPPPTPEQIEGARLQSIQDAIAGDTTLASLKAMTNADFDAWWAANVTTAVQAIGVLKRLFRVVLRRVL